MNDEHEKLKRIEAAAHGDVASLEWLLYDYYGEMLNHIARKLPAGLRSFVSAEDILQETFSSVFQGINTFETQGVRSFVGWLKTIADNKLTDAIRKARREPPRAPAPPQPTDNGSLYADLLDIVAAGDPTASRFASRQEGIEAIQVAIASLPDHYREAIQLHYVKRLTLDEVAKVMHTTSGAVHGWMGRAKKKMRESLGRASDYLSAK